MLPTEFFVTPNPARREERTLNFWSLHLHCYIHSMALMFTICPWQVRLMPTPHPRPRGLVPGDVWVKCVCGELQDLPRGEGKKLKKQEDRAIMCRKCRKCRNRKNAANICKIGG